MERLGELRPWLREEQRAAFEAAWAWLGPRCRTEEERRMGPALLLLLAPFNALVTPCRPVAGSCVNFQVTLSRQGPAGPERLRLAVRAGSGDPACGRTGVQALRPPGVRPAPSDLPAPSDPSDLGRERLKARSSERLALWLEEETVTNDPLACAAAVLRSLLDLGSKNSGRKTPTGART